MSYLLLEIAREINISPKDLKVAHLNICSLRNKVEELRVIQTIFGFDILSITETHLNSSDRDQDLHIDGLKFIRRDRPINAKAEVAFYTTLNTSRRHTARI